MASTGERPRPYGASLSHLSMPAAVPSAASPFRAQPSLRMPGMDNAHGAVNRPVLKMQAAPGLQAAPHLLPAPGMSRGPGPVSVAGAPYVPGSPRAQGPPFIPMVPGPPKTDFKHKALTQWEAESLLKRYPGNTVLTLLREVAKQGSSKIDWAAIHQRIGAAVAGPREAQAIWRHLAYGHAIPDKPSHDLQPLDDDSDIDETDVTKPSTPGINLAMQMDATAWVKNDLRRIGLEVAASGALRRRLTLPSPGARPSNSAPLGVGMRPGGISPVGSSLLGQKRPAHILTQTSSGSRPGSPGFAGTNRPSPLSPQYSPHVSPHVPQNPSPLGPNKRRRLWSDEEDKTLIEAVQKHGEGHWEEMRQHFSSDRTAAQLMQRWALIHKRPAIHPPDSETPKPLDGLGREAGRITRSTDSRLRHGGGWGQPRSTRSSTGGG